MPSPTKPETAPTKPEQTPAWMLTIRNTVVSTAIIGIGGYIAVTNAESRASLEAMVTRLDETQRGVVVNQARSILMLEMLDKRLIVVENRK